MIITFIQLEKDIQAKNWWLNISTRVFRDRGNVCDTDRKPEGKSKFSGRRSSC